MQVDGDFACHDLKPLSDLCLIRPCGPRGISAEDEHLRVTQIGFFSDEAWRHANCRAIYYCRAWFPLAEYLHVDHWSVFPEKLAAGGRETPAAGGLRRARRKRGALKRSQGRRGDVAAVARAPLRFL
jgi:hypothetical protein